MMKTKILIALFTLICVMVALAACTESHEFSTKWEMNADGHWNVCSVDGCTEKTEAAHHIYGEGRVTTPATEAAEGVMTYACTVCGYEKTESIAKLEHKHSWDEEWTNDETHHWHESSCGHDDSAKEAHLYDDGYITKPATDTEAGTIVYTCVYCGYHYEDELSITTHRHEYSEEWTSDESSHWHAATCGHGNVKGKDSHEFDEGKVTKQPTEYEEGVTSYFCKTCNYEKQVPIDKLPHTHSFAEEWSKNETYHWYAALCGHSEEEVKYAHSWNDGEITTQPTETKEGEKTFTCSECGQTKTQAIASLSHTHTFETEYTHDTEYHWFKPTCGHEDALTKVEHNFDENGDCVCGAHGVCEVCGGCLIDTCTEHDTKCLFRNNNYVVTFAPQANYLGAPEGPDGLAPGSSGAYIYETSITAKQVVLADGAHATQVIIPNGAAAHSGVSFWNNKLVAEAGKAGYNCGVPQYANIVKPLRMHFTNNGTTEVTFKYSAIDYYYDKGAVTVTLAAGESKTVVMNTTFEMNTVGLNHQIVFPDGAEKGASLTIWGEFVADGLDNGISIGQAASKTTYYVGETFNTAGLVLRGSSTLTYNNSTDSWSRVYISKNYITNFDGHVFTSEDVGIKTVTVSFGGFTTTYTINVINHDSDKCSTCGNCTNQVCEYPDCDDKCQGHFDADSMTVMSFNLGTNGINNQYNKPNLLNKLVTELPDLLGTQEENSLWTAALTDTLARYGYKNVIMYRDGYKDSSLGNEGAGIWYNSLRFELEEWGYFWMSDTPDTASIWSQYGAQYKRVTTWAKLTDKASGKTFVYYNTHIGYESSELWVRSADMIMERMHAHYNEGYPVIITGDFNFALNTDGAMPAYERFMQGLSDPHYTALVKNYEVGKENTFSGYGEYQGAGDEAISDVGNRKHVLPIDYMLYSGEFIANTYTILREELPEGVTSPDRQYFSSDHFAIKTVFNFAENWGTHICWEPCEDCGLCLDLDCEKCESKCPGHHVCDTLCPDCGLCANLDGECRAENYCPAYVITLDGATFESGKATMVGCKISETIVTDSGKTFEGFLDASKNYYTVDDLAALELTGNIKFTALYQEDMLAWAQSDTCNYETVASAEHRIVNGLYVTTVTYPKGTAAGTFFAGRGAKDSGSMDINWCAPAKGKNVGIVYIYSYAQNDVKIKYETENYGAQNEELIVTLKPGLNRIVLTFAIQDTHNSFYSCDHRIYLVDEAAEDIVLDTYGYFYAEGLVENFGVSSSKLVYKPGDTFTLDNVKVTAKVNGYTTTLHKYVCDFAEGYVFTADDIGTKTITVSMGDHKASFEIEIVDADCEAGNHYNIKDTADANFVGVVGSDAMYNYSCALCGTKSDETYAADKILFTPHNNIGDGHTIEFVTLEDGRIAAKLTFNSNVTKDDKFVITANSYPEGTNVTFPVSGAGRLVYMEMISSADIKLTWQPEYYGDRDGITLELKAGVANSGSWTIKYDSTSNNSDSSVCPYQEIVAGSDIAAGTVVYLTGYFYTVDEVAAISLNTEANKLTFKVGDTFTSAGLSLKPTSSNSQFAETVIYNVTTDLDGYVFTAADVGTKRVTASWGDFTYTYEITVTE